MRLLLILTAIFAIASSSNILGADITLAECKREASVSQRINLSAGVYTEKARVNTPLHIDLPAVTNDKIFIECLVKNGLFDNKTAEQYIAKQDRCRTKTRLLTANLTEGKTRIGQSGHSEDFDACMRSNIGVEVLPSPKN